MKSKTTFVAVIVLIIVSIYASSTMLPIFVEARKTVTNIDCWPQDGGKTRCCGSEVDETSIYGFGTATYCTTCDDTKPPSNCSPREKIENAKNSPSAVLNNNLEVKGDKTDDNKTPSDFGRLENGVITKDDTKEGNNDTKVPMDFGRLEDDVTSKESSADSDDTKFPKDSDNLERNDLESEK
jgi:hypothetical protein